MLDRLKEFFKKYKKAILLIVAILLILVIIFFVLPAPKQKVVSEKTIPGAGLVETAAAPAEVSAEDKAKANIAVVAKNFAEIYGSYSNQSNYSNLEGALLLASASYRDALSTTLNQYRLSYQPAVEYQGVTTIAINALVESFNETTGKAVVTVKTQRKESSGMQSNYAVKYQDMRLSLVKEGGFWKVDGASWQ